MVIIELKTAALPCTLNYAPTCCCTSVVLGDASYLPCVCVFVWLLCCGSDFLCAYFETVFISKHVLLRLYLRYSSTIFSPNLKLVYTSVWLLSIMLWGDEWYATVCCSKGKAILRNEIKRKQLIAWGKIRCQFNFLKFLEKSDFSGRYSRHVFEVLGMRTTLGYD
jgi:hypothetical protein